MRKRAFLRLFALLAALMVVAAACGGNDGGGEQTEGAQGTTSDVTLIHGTTDTVVSLDPAGAYDLGSWNLIWNLYSGLMSIPPGGDTPEPDLAESCNFDDP